MNRAGTTRRTAIIAVAVMAVAVALTVVPAAAGAGSGGGGRLVVTGTVIHSPVAYGRAYALNDRGQVLVAGGARALVWQRGVLTDLGALGADYAYAHDINERGQIVGDSGSRAFRWERGVMTELQTGSGEFTPSSARAINDNGEVAGLVNNSRAVIWRGGRTVEVSTSDYGQPPRGINNQGQVIGLNNVGPFVWERGVTTQLNPPVAPQAWSFPVDINERGQILFDDVPDDTAPITPVYLWDQGTFTDVGTLGGGLAQATAVNDRGQVVGSSLTRSGAWHAFVWERGVMTDLGTLGGASSFVNDINEAGQMVGNSETASGAIHGFVWDRGVMTDLGTLGRKTSFASAINDTGMIAGATATGNGEGEPAAATIWRITR